jgi:hypothetical protein
MLLNRVFPILSIWLFNIFSKNFNKYSMKAIYLGALALLFMSCSITKSGTAKTIDIVGAGVIHKPVAAELEVKQEKVVSSVTFKSTDVSVNMKNEAVRKVLADYKGDVLIEPNFQTESSRGTTTVTVTGFVGHYKNFHTATADEIKLMEFKPSILHKADVSESATKNKKGAGWLIGLGLAVLALVVVTSL